ncbi:sensor histidine kinase, partial [uncultured Flavonifractor sp.]
MEPVSEDLGLLLVEQFREQMNNLAAAVQLLTPVVQEKGGRQYEPYLAILHQSMYRMMRMLGNLEYLQLPEGELTAERASLDLAGLCRTLGEQVASLARQAGLSFTYEEERGSLITTGDAPQLRRMLLGLISNAFRAAGKGGHTGLRLAVRQDRAVLTVWDDGPGLPPPEEER